MGDVTFRPRIPYNRTILNTYGNAPRPPVELQPGRTAVDIGFLDFMGLAHSAALSAAALQARDGTEADRVAPARWVGYEASEFSVAKALVVSEMLVAGTPADHIVQVRCRQQHATFIGVYIHIEHLSSTIF